MALKGKIYSLAKQREDIDSRNVFESMIKQSANQKAIVMDGRNLAAGSIFADQISAGAITTGKIKADAVTTDKIIAGAITAGHLAANSVTAEKISVDELSAITSDIGTITAGLIKSGNGSSYFNMTEGKFSFANDKILYDGKDLSISADSINLEGKVTFSSFDNSLQTTVNNKAETSYVNTQTSGAEQRAKDHADTKASEVKTVADNAQKRADDAFERVEIKDTRDKNETPVWYYDNYPMQIVQELKGTSTMGIGTSLETYGTLLTTIPWTDSSGGRVKQEFKVKDRMFTRDGATSSWTAWKDALGEAEAAKTSASNAQSTANTASSKADTAQGTANTANTKASSAASAAAAAQSTADTASTTAANAKTKTDAWSWDDTTEIDGGAIRTGTITADKIQANSITSAEIQADSITSTEINVNELSSIASNIGTVNAGLIKSFDESIIINLNEGLITLGKPLKIQGKTVATEDDISSLGYGDIISKSGQKIFTDQAEDSAVHVEVDGKSYQENDEPTPDNPSEIHSLNDFDVVSSAGGRNYLLGSQYLEATGGASGHTFTVGDNGYIEITSTTTSGYISNLGFNKSRDLFNSNVEVGEAYTVSFAVRTLNGTSSTIDYYDNNAFSYTRMEGEISDKFSRLHVTGVKRNSELSMHLKFNGVGKFEIKEAKLEKGNTATDWTPAPEDITPDTNHPLIDKVNLSLDEPLRSVGDVKDRLFRDSDGLWKIERNIYQILLDGSIGFVYYRESDYRPAGHLAFRLNTPTIMPTRGHRSTNDINSHFDTNTLGEMNRSKVVGVEAYLGDDGIGTELYLVVPTNIASTTEQMQNWVKQQYDSENPVTHLFPLATPTIETLDQELQDRLNTLKSFKGSNYIYTVNNTEDLPDQIKENLIPTLHANFKGSGWLPKYNAEQARIDLESETNDIRNDMDNLVTLDQHNLNKEETDRVLNDYQAAIDVARRELNGLVNEDGGLILGEDGKPLQKGVVNEVLDLLDRTALVESDYGEHSKKLKFMDTTEFVMGVEGMFIGDTETRTGIMISPRVEETTEHEARASRIDFLDNDKVVAYISSYMMEISRGIFVESAQIGEHKIETIGDGHTTFQWIPK